ncbi:class I SAM-dependent methyltransferase [Pontimonas sp.]|nr:class I SAM-dependent methyltransferase [Pontimonas sp.]
MSESKVASLREYYSAKVRQYGATPAGVDWSNSDGQLMRFGRFLPLLESEKRSSFSVLDFGCGYGALVDFLTESSDREFQYTGIDLSREMLEAGRKRFISRPNVEFLDRLEEHCAYDFVVASGVFNVRLENEIDDWEIYVRQTMRELFRIAAVGMSINFLSNGPHLTRRDDHLFYQSPGQLVQFVSEEISPLMFLDQSYSPWEFTISVLKAPR